MADIEVRLDLDDSKYSQSLKRAEQNAKTFSNTVVSSFNNVGGGFSKFSGGLDAINNKLGGLTRGLLGVGMAAFVGSLVQGAERAMDMASALDVNIARLKEMEFAAGRAGIGADELQQMMGRLQVTISNAIDGNEGAQKSLRGLGVTIEDINSKSPDQLFNQVAVTLSKIDDTARRAGLSTDALGKAAIRTDWRGYVQGIQSAYGTMDAYGRSIQQADLAGERFGEMIGMIRNEILKIISPLLGLTGTTNDLGKSMQLARGIALALVAAMAAFTFTQVIAGFVAVGRALKTVGTLLGIVTVEQVALNAAQNAGAASSIKYAAGLQNVIGFLGKYKGAALAVAGATALLYSSNLNEGEDEYLANQRQGMDLLKKRKDALNGLSEAEKKRYNALSQLEKNSIIDSIVSQNEAKKQQDIMAKITGQGQSAKGNAVFGETSEQKAKREKAMADMKAAAEKMAQANKTERVALDGVVTGYARRNEEVQRGLKFAIESLNIAEKDQALTQMSERNKMVKEAMYEAEKNYLTEINGLLTKYRNYAIGSPEEQAQLGKVQQAIKDVSAQYEAQLPVLEELTNRYVSLQEARQLNLYSINRQIEVENELMRIQHEIATSTMSEIEKKYADIDFAAQQSARAAIAAEEARRGAKLDPVEAVEYYEAAMKGSDRLKAKQKELFDQSRTFSTGWKRAFREYADNATNAARQAERIFQKATSGMEDLIVGFAKTGKFEWKTFVASMLEELLRSQIQVIFAQLIGGMSDSMGGMFGGRGAGAGASGGGFFDNILGGIGSAIGGLFGMGGGSGSGSSATNPVYVYDISGGAGAGGGGGVMGAATGGIWDSISSGIGNVWEGVKSVGSGVWDAVSGLGGSVFDALGGLGGTIIDGISSIFNGGVSSGAGAYGIDENPYLNFGQSSMGGGFLDSIGDFFGGFFAKGGTLGAGKWGIAGEAGPELISGPATITPMGGGSMVTYNINAVDAMSFKTLLAQDPSFIYGLTLQGSKGIAARR
jgi:lambda family phage tail tape measure protein